MSRVPTILLYVMNPHRDGLTMHIIGNILAVRYGYKVRYCTDANVVESLRYFKPALTVLAWLSSEYTQMLAKMAVKYGKCTIIFSEKGYVNPDAEIDYFSRAPEQLRKTISAIFTMGNATRDNILKGGLYDDNQIITIGKLDHDLLLFRPDQISERSFDVGVPFDNVNINPHNFSNAIQMTTRAAKYMAIAKPKTVGRYMPAEMMEQTAVTIAVFMTMQQLEKRKIPARICLRPHPYERVDSYSDIKRHFHDISVFADHRSLLHRWLPHLRVILHMISTVSVDAYLLGVPSISVCRLLPDYVQKVRNDDPVNSVQNDYIKWQWCPESYDECIELIKAAMEGRLPLCPEITKDAYEDYIDKWFSFKRKIPASVLAAKRIADIAGEGGASAPDVDMDEEWMNVSWLWGMASNYIKNPKNKIKLLQASFPGEARRVSAYYMEQFGNFL